MRARSTSRHRWWRPAAAALITGALAAPAHPAPAGATPDAPQPGGVEVVDLPAGLQPIDINDRGLILGRMGPDVVVVDDDGGPTRTVGPWEPFRNPLCPPGPICFWPSPGALVVNERGVVATSIGGRATLWDDGERTDLNGDAAGSWVLGLNDRGQALVTRIFAEHQEVGIWHRGTFTEIGRWELDHQVVAQLSERGEAFLTILVVRPPTPTVSMRFWSRGETTPFVGFVPRALNRYGEVAGEQTNPADPFDNFPAVWDDGEVTLLADPGGRGANAVAINDRGQVLGNGTFPDAPVTRALLWDDGGLVEVGAATDTSSTAPVDLTERGQVLFSGYTPRFHRGGFVWDDGDVVRLPPGDDHDVVPIAMNERGQVVGTRAPISPTGPVVPTLWEL
jgi:hypothetical protein